MPSVREVRRPSRAGAAFVLALAASSLIGAPAQATPRDTVPQWFRESLARLTQGSGRWVTDNSRYQSSDEPFPSYGLEYLAGLTGQTARGRLFGIRADGTEQNFWEFYLYWDPFAGKAMVTQTHVGGPFGVGELRVTGPAVEEMEQSFWWGEGSTTPSLHREQVTDQERRSESFDWQNGAWAPRRQYVWKRSG